MRLGKILLAFSAFIGLNMFIAGCTSVRTAKEHSIECGRTIEVEGGGQIQHFDADLNADKTKVTWARYVKVGASEKEMDSAFINGLNDFLANPVDNGGLTFHIAQYLNRNLEPNDSLLSLWLCWEGK